MVGNWRLIQDEDRSAALNMAIDEVLMRMCASDESPPTIRLYGWETPSISLGFHQTLKGSGIDADYCKRVGIELVRRPTGGRAVLHGHDLTFSIAIHEADLPEDRRRILDSHLWLMKGIQQGLKLVGVNADIGIEKHPSHENVSGDCFAHIAPCDLSSREHKIAGSAQLRKWDAVLEQGSIPCEECKEDYIRIFGETSAPNESLGISIEALRDALPLGFMSAIGISLDTSSLSEKEMNLALKLASDKYSREEWTCNHRSISVDNYI